jgi:hypothetical protein
MTIGQENHGKNNGEDEEANITGVRFSIHAKLSHKSHRASDDTSDETCSSY